MNKTNSVTLHNYIGQTYRKALMMIIELKLAISIKKREEPKHFIIINQ